MIEVGYITVWTVESLFGQLNQFGQLTISASAPTIFSSSTKGGADLYFAVIRLNRYIILRFPFGERASFWLFFSALPRPS